MKDSSDNYTSLTPLRKRQIIIKLKQDKANRLSSIQGGNG
jgi:hypothetical protein